MISRKYRADSIDRQGFLIPSPTSNFALWLSAPLFLLVGDIGDINNLSNPGEMI